MFATQRCGSPAPTQGGGVETACPIAYPFNRISPYIQSLNINDPTFGMVAAGGGGKTLQLDARIEF